MTDSLDKNHYPAFIIVLGHLMDKAGVLNDETSRRVASALDADYKYAAEAFVLCGWAYRPDSNVTIADAMRRHILGTRPDLSPKLLLQHLSRDTVGDAFFSRVLLECVYGIVRPSIVIATSDYHSQRSLEIFSMIFEGYAGSVSAEGCNSLREGKSMLFSELESIKAFRRTFSGTKNGDLNSIHATLVNRHPFYNGQIYPKIGSVEEIVAGLQRTDSFA